jgi:hypothetical protein
MKPNIKPNQSLKQLINTEIGYININKSWVNHNNTYECAAWWEDSEIKTGVYPLILEQNKFAPNNLQLRAKLDATVVDDFFPALWGGMAISNKPYKPKNVGSTRNIYKVFDLVDAITKTGHSPGNDIDFCVNPLIWEGVVSSARDSMLEYQKMSDNYMQDYYEVGDGAFDTNLSMIAHCSENMAALCKAISDIKRHQSYLTDSSDYMRNLYTNNISWVKAA